MGEASLPETEALAPGPAGTDSTVVLLLTTFPDHERAAAAARIWVEARLAACVHITAAGHSVYRWNEQVETAEEVTLTAKTTADRIGDLQQALRRDHPYELPEVLLVWPGGGSEAYLEWVRGACRPTSAAGDAAPAASAR